MTLARRRSFQDASGYVRCRAPREGGISGFGLVAGPSDCLRGASGDAPRISETPLITSVRPEVRRVANVQEASIATSRFGTTTRSRLIWPGPAQRDVLEA